VGIIGHGEILTHPCITFIKKQNMEKQATKNSKVFTELLQRSFVLKAMGLNNKEIEKALAPLGYNAKADAIRKHCGRINDFYKNAEGYGSMDYSISKAWENGDMRRLIEKYRSEFSRYIEAFEKIIVITFEDLPEAE